VHTGLVWYSESMPRQIPRPTPLVSDVPRHDALQRCSETSWLQSQGFECVIALEGVSASGQVSHESNRQKGRASSRPTLHRHEFWVHPDGALAQVSFFQQGLRLQWLVNHAKLFAFGLASRFSAQDRTPDTTWLAQPNGSVVLRWCGTGLEKMERVWGWAQQAKAARQLLPFSQWDGIQGRALPLSLSSMLMDWAEVRIANPGDTPLVHERIASSQIVRSASAIDRELVRHVSSLPHGPSLSFWRRCLKADLASHLSHIHDHGLVPQRLPPLLQGVEGRDYLGVPEQLHIKDFHEGLARVFHGHGSKEGFSSEESVVVNRWYQWLYWPAEEFCKKVESLPVTHRVQGGDFLDLLCGFPFHPGVQEKIEAVLGTLPIATLTARLAEEDSLGMNLTLRLLSLANQGPSTAKEDDLDQTIEIPVGYQILESLKKVCGAEHFSMKTSRWSALSMVLGVNALSSDYLIQRRKRHEYFLHWSADLPVGVPLDLRFPQAQGAEDVPLDEISPTRLNRALEFLKNQGHPEFLVESQGEDVAALKELNARLRERSLDKTLPLVRSTTLRARF